MINFTTKLSLIVNNIHNSNYTIMTCLGIPRKAHKHSNCTQMIRHLLILTVILYIISTWTKEITSICSNMVLLRFIQVYDGSLEGLVKVLCSLVDTSLKSCVTHIRNDWKGE